MNRILERAGIVSCGALALMALNAYPAVADPAPTLPSAFVTEIVDGDTVRVVDAARGPITVRLAGVDAPELNECYGPQARDFASAALNRQLVAVIVDPSTGAVDAAGELSAYVVRVDGWNHNIEAARSGAARAAEDVSRSVEIRNAADAARSIGAGLWGASCDPPPPTPRPTPVPRDAPRSAGVYFENCDDARSRGAAPVLRGQDGYRAGLDRDNDGIGCE